MMASQLMNNHHKQRQPKHSTKTGTSMQGMSTKICTTALMCNDKTIIRSNNISAIFTKPQPNKTKFQLGGC